MNVVHRMLAHFVCDRQCLQSWTDRNQYNSARFKKIACVAVLIVVFIVIISFLWSSLRLEVACTKTVDLTSVIIYNKNVEKIVELARLHNQVSWRLSQRDACSVGSGSFHSVRCIQRIIRRRSISSWITFSLWKCERYSNNPKLDGPNKPDSCQG